ncbi:MAG: helix-turn-helix transcriptional regulator [Terriglobia bacterium]
MRRADTARDAGGSHTPEQAFGLTLRRIRLKRGLSQQALADRSGYHRAYIGLLEGGHKSPSLRTVFNIATTLQVQPSRPVAGVERLVNRGGRGKGAGVSGIRKRGPPEIVSLARFLASGVQ